MDNDRIANMLNTIAVFLEIKGGDPYEIQSYVKASQAVEKMKKPVSLLLQEGCLQCVEGIDDEFEKTIAEFVSTGEVAYLKNLRQLFPATLPDLLKVDGIGPKSVKILYETLNIASLDGLYRACLENKVAQIPGFSIIWEHKILESLEFLKQQQEYFRLNNGWHVGAALRARILENTPASAVEVAGSLRRFNEIVRDVTIVAACGDAVPVMKCFLRAPESEGIVAVGRFKSTITAKDGIPVHLHVVPPGQFPFALLFLTGSKEHTNQLCKHAASLKLNLTDKGLSRQDGTLVICNDEKAIYAALNLPYPAPEIREGIFEFDSDLPSPLVNRSDLAGLVHCHSTWSDGKNSLAEMAHETRQLGYTYLVATDHSQSSAYVHGLTPERIEQQHAEINEINDLDLSGFRIVKGIECDILPEGSLDYDPDILRSFEFIIASVHSCFDMTKDEATTRIIRAIENPFTSAIGHLTGRLLLTRRGYEMDVEKVVDAAVANGVAFEINANPRRLDMDWRHLHEAADKGAHFVIGPDAHRLAGLYNVHYGVGIARKGALTPEHILNCLPVEEFVQWRKS
jgi:DNA polymerase (family X)